MPLARWGLLLLMAAACSRSAPRNGGDAVDTARAGSDPPRVGVIDSTALPVIISFRRDSLGLPPGASMQRVDSAIAAVLPVLRRVVDFDLLAISPAILAVSVRPKPPMRPAELVAALRGHRLVADVEVSGIVRIR